MSGPVRIQLSRKKGWRLPANTVKVDRTTKWGNPFIVNSHVAAGSKSGGAYICVPTVEDAVACFREMMACDGEGAQLRRDNLPELRGVNLACWCALDALCHADVLLELANAPPISPRRAE